MENVLEGMDVFDGIVEVLDFFRWKRKFGGVDFVSIYGYFLWWMFFNKCFVLIILVVEVRD